MSLPYPDDGRVDAAAVVVFGWMSNQPNVTHPNKRQATRLARLLLRGLYLSPSTKPELSAGSSPISEATIRWCHHCRAQRATVYQELAMRCLTCGFATIALEKPVQQLT